MYHKPEPELAGDHVAVAKVYLQMNQPAPALDHARKALESGFAMAGTHNPEGEANAYGLEGTALTQLGRWSDAIDPLEKALALKPDSPTLYMDLATAWLAGGRKDKALTVLRRGSEMAPSSPQVLMSLLPLLA